MTEDPFKNKQERLAVKIEIARPEDWKKYKEIWLQAIKSPEREMFASTYELIREEEKRVDEEWQGDIFKGDKLRSDMFVLLSWKDFEVVGMNRAEEEEPGVWYLSSAYVKPEFRGGLGTRMFATRLKEILKRGGRKVTGAVKKNNLRNIHIAEKFGFKIVGETGSGQGYLIELDLTDEKVIKKIDDVLNAG